MGKITKAQPVKLFVGMLSHSVEVLAQAQQILYDKYGTIDTESQVWPFLFTDYYSKEMGSPLLRKFITFSPLINPQEIIRIKIDTNNIEDEFTQMYCSPQRPVNLDPGYLALSKLVLATTKDYSHRIYLGDGIYAETTLRYFRNKFIAWDWTYPDYRTPHYLEFFEEIRMLYRKQLLLTK